MKPRGSVTLDAGAVAALQRGNSLLPAGVIAVPGPFERGDSIALMDATNHVIGTGLARYSSQEAERIKGHHSAEIEALQERIAREYGYELKGHRLELYGVKIKR